MSSPSPEYQRSPSTSSDAEIAIIDPALLRLGLDTYRNLFDLFYKLNFSEAAEFLNELCHHNPDMSLSSQDIAGLLSIEVGHDKDTQLTDDEDKFCVVFTYRNDEHGSFTRTLLDPISLDLVTGDDDILEPYPSYVFCVPSSRSILHKEGIEFDFCHFIPFIDDGRFPARRYMANLIDIPWQENMEDPLVLSIQLELLRQLHYNDELELGIVDTLEILPSHISILNKAHQSTILTLPNDFLYKSEDTMAPPHLLSTYLGLNPLHQSVTPSSNLDKHADHILDSFCPLLGCLRLKCGGHENFSGPISSQTPFVPSYFFQHQPLAHACKNACYLKSKICHADLDYLNQFEWKNEADIRALSSLLNIMPDDKPCDLAVILRKPCWEVFLHRRLLRPDDQIPIEPENQGCGHGRIRKFVDVPQGNALSYEMLSPCAHLGPCNATSECNCFKHSQHCQRNCHCSVKCEIRWKGCKCRATNRNGYKSLCQTGKCPCYSVLRECDPEICFNCNAAKTSWADSCKNTQIQRSQSSAIVVKQSEYGFGAFAGEIIRPGRLIGDYTGERSKFENGLMPSTTDWLKTLIMDFTGRNYLFNLCNQFTIDAFYLGNETRFLNDSSETNCYTKEMDIVGERRIGIWSSNKVVKAGTELTLHYGDGYWQASNSHEDPGSQRMKEDFPRESSDSDPYEPEESDRESDS